MSKPRLIPLDSAIVSSFAHACDAVVHKYKVDVIDFMEKAVKSDMFLNYRDETCVYGQSPYAIAKIFLDDIGEPIKPIEDEKYLLYDREAGYWMGYLLMYWYFLFPEEIAFIQGIHMDYLYWNYDAYHTQDLFYVMRLVKDEKQFEA